MVFQRKHDPKTLTVVACPMSQRCRPSPVRLSRAGESVIGKDMSIEGQIDHRPL